MCVYYILSDLIISYLCRDKVSLASDKKKLWRIINTLSFTLSQDEAMHTNNNTNNNNVEEGGTTRVVRKH